MPGNLECKRRVYEGRSLSCKRRIFGQGKVHKKLLVFNFMTVSSRIIIVLLFIVITIALSECAVTATTPVKVSSQPITNSNGQELAGSESCRKCHAAIYDSVIQTAHFKTSQPANATSIQGGFDQVFHYDYSRSVWLNATDSGFYQVAIISEDTLRRERFDIVVGSGEKGQTYLYWHQDSLFQLPLTYFSSIKQWVNSPGFPKDKIVFNRPVNSFCMDCHSTNFKEKFPAEQFDPSLTSNVFDKKQVLFSVGCERCHGPGKEHIQFHEANPKEKTAHHIVNNRKLTRALQLDVCASCHSGMRTPLQPAFSFTPGQSLENFSLPVVQQNSEELDVHGNQFGLMAASKCFIKSNSMTCSSCHSSHQMEGDLAIFSARCMSCHSIDKNFCKLYPDHGNKIINNCIDCHMPAKPSKIISLMAEGNEMVNNMIRTHFIKVYPDESNAWLKGYTK